MHGAIFCGPTMARTVPTILLHFLHPWKSDVGSAENAWSNFLPTHHGKDYSYNPVAFPPSMEVRCGKCRQKQGSALTMTAKAGEEMRHTKPSKQTMLF
jgi:hypothetical protein